MLLPPMFCWTKFGTEAGEDVEAILHRKEAERAGNGGVFLWGIGSSVGPSLAALVRVTAAPEVVFTPMLSRPARRDTAPAEVVVWRSASGLDGAAYELPAHSVVTSRGEHRRRHYALVCRSERPLRGSAQGVLDPAEVRNLVTGSPVGSSQVTAVVERVDPPSQPQRRYLVAFRAQLVHPFLITLRGPVPLPGPLRLSEGTDPAALRSELARVRSQTAGPTEPLTLFATPSRPSKRWSTG